MAAARHERALRLLGERIPRRGRFVVPLLRQIIVHSPTRSSRERAGRRSPAQAPPLRRGCAPEGKNIHLLVRGWARACGWAHLRGMNLAERYPPTAARTGPTQEHAPVNATIPWFGASSSSRRSIEIRREFGDRWGKGRSLLSTAGCSTRPGAFPRRSRTARRPMPRTHQQPGSAEHGPMAHRRVLLPPGPAGRGRANRPGGAPLGGEFGDVQAAGISLGFWAKAGGEVPRQHVRDALRPHQGDVEALGRLAASDPRRARPRRRPDPRQVARRVRGAGPRLVGHRVARRPHPRDRPGPQAPRAACLRRTALPSRCARRYPEQPPRTPCANRGCVGRVLRAAPVASWTAASRPPTSAAATPSAGRPRRRRRCPGLARGR